MVLSTQFMAQSPALGASSLGQFPTRKLGTWRLVPTTGSLSTQNSGRSTILAKKSLKVPTASAQGPPSQVTLVHCRALYSPHT